MKRKKPLTVKEIGAVGKAIAALDPFEIGERVRVMRKPHPMFYETMDRGDHGECGVIVDTDGSNRDDGDTLHIIKLDNGKQIRRWRSWLERE